MKTEDGIKLMTDLYRPKTKDSKRFPSILVRTPYGKSGIAAFVKRFAEQGYNVIVQDTRGRGRSGGHFNPMINEEKDGKDTVRWIEKQPWFNGRLGAWGMSYLGYVQWAITKDPPECLKALVPVVSSPQHFQHVHPDGAFSLESRLLWIHALDAKQAFETGNTGDKMSIIVDHLFGKYKKTLARAYRHLPMIDADIIVKGEKAPFYRDMITHTKADDEFWKPRDHRKNLNDLNIPVHMVSGWFDLLLRGTLDAYKRLKKAGCRPYITIGPWHHSQVELTLFSTREALKWFDHHLKGVEEIREKPVRIFVMGADEWKTFNEWPPESKTKKYFLNADSRLSTGLPGPDTHPDEFKYNPADPTPSIGGAGLDEKCAGPVDNSVLESRDDVLCYTSNTLDSPIEIIGNVNSELYVKSSLDQTDFFARICDVDEKGRSVNICDGLFRIEPGRGEFQQDGSMKINIDMWATAYKFKKGHRIRLMISSGAHPRWSRNLGAEEHIALGKEMKAAMQMVFHDVDHPSSVNLPIWKSDVTSWKSEKERHQTPKSIENPAPSCDLSSNLHLSFKL